MIFKEIQSKLEKEPFAPLRLKLVSGKTVRVSTPNSAFLLPNALLIIRGKRPGKAMVEGYDVIALRNIENIESSGQASRRNGVH